MPEAGFEMEVEDVFRIAARGTVVVGVIASGSVEVGDRAELDRSSGPREVVVEGIEIFREDVRRAEAGDHVGLVLGGAGEQEVEPGDVLRAS